MNDFSQTDRETRRFSLIDRLLIEVDHGLRTTLSRNRPAGTPSPAGAVNGDEPLSEADRDLAEGLMRINHTGEIAAQALYRGQALTAADAGQRDRLLGAADEEQDHLAWCEQRLTELHGHPSRLAPLWYGGSFAIGLAAGLAGDRWSLGFVEETEKQVSDHLDDHLDRLPAGDRKSRVIVEQMRIDEARHADAAREAGARNLPAPVRRLMTAIADLMRAVSFRF